MKIQLAGAGGTERFWAKVDKTPTCWLWSAAVNDRGYGVTGFGRRTLKAHRFAWELVHGQIPKGMCVLHRCDNPPCVNPNHLFLGTHADNVADKVKKGRQERGEDHSCAKLTWSAINACRLRHDAGTTTISGLAREFGVARRTMQDVVHYRTWRTV